MPGLGTVTGPTGMRGCWKPARGEGFEGLLAKNEGLLEPAGGSGGLGERWA